MAKNEMTDARYLGKICDHHPEFNGLRLKRSYQCVQCCSENKARVPRGTMSKTSSLEMRINTLRKEWDAHNTAMREISKKLEVLTLEEEAVWKAKSGAFHVEQDTQIAE